jgi:hypothetical protein
MQSRWLVTLVSRLFVEIIIAKCVFDVDKSISGVLETQI